MPPNPNGLLLASGLPSLSTPESMLARTLRLASSTGPHARTQRMVRQPSDPGSSSVACTPFRLTTHVRQATTTRSSQSTTTPISRSWRSSRGNPPFAPRFLRAEYSRPSQPELHTAPREIDQRCMASYGWRAPPRPLGGLDVQMGRGYRRGPLESEAACGASQQDAAVRRVGSGRMVALVKGMSSGARKAVAPKSDEPAGSRKASWLARLRAALRKRIQGRSKRGANIYPLY